jgi:hypothetical protein
MVDITSGKGRKEAQLPKSLSGRLKDYALMAGAAGVGVMALAPGAQAGIVYGPGFTANSNLTGCNPSGTSACNNALATVFSINGIQELDFTNQYISNPNTHTQFGSFGVASANGSGAMVMTSFLEAGAMIGPGNTFTSSTKLAGQQWTNTNAMTPTPGAAAGPWGAHIGQTGYLEFDFNNGGTTDYGYLVVTIEQNPTNHSLSEVVTGYAYDNTGAAMPCGAGGCVLRNPGYPHCCCSHSGRSALGHGGRRSKP